MNTLSYKTVSANAATVEHKWLVVDMENKVLGRAASKIAAILRGKHKTYYTPHVDCGDYVIIINAEKVRYTGKKLSNKIYKHYTGYPGGQKTYTAQQLISRKPTEPVERAIKGMLPKTILGRQMYKKLFVYAGNEHPHTAQKPTKLEL